MLKVDILGQNSYSSWTTHVLEGRPEAEISHWKSGNDGQPAIWPSVSEVSRFTHQFWRNVFCLQFELLTYYMRLPPPLSPIVDASLCITSCWGQPTYGWLQRRTRIRSHSLGFSWFCHLFSAGLWVIFNKSCCFIWSINFLTYSLRSWTSSFKAFCGFQTLENLLKGETISCRQCLGDILCPLHDCTFCDSVAIVWWVIASI